MPEWAGLVGMGLAALAMLLVLVTVAILIVRIFLVVKGNPPHHHHRSRHHQPLSRATLRVRSQPAASPDDDLREVAVVEAAPAPPDAGRPSAPK